MKKTNDKAFYANLVFMVFPEPRGPRDEVGLGNELQNILKPNVLVSKIPPLAEFTPLSYEITEELFLSRRR